METVLALTGVGAKEDTANEIYSSISLPQDPKQVQGIYRKLIPEFRGNSYYNLSTANKVYIQKDFAVLDEFKQTAVDVFGSEVQNIDFAVSVFLFYSFRCDSYSNVQFTDLCNYFYKIINGFCTIRIYKCMPQLGTIYSYIRHLRIFLNKYRHISIKMIVVNHIAFLVHVCNSWYKNNYVINQ